MNDINNIRKSKSKTGFVPIERDIRVLIGIAERGSMTTKQIGKQYFPNVKKAGKRLGIYHNNNIVEKNRRLRTKSSGSSELIYTLTKKGQKILQQITGINNISYKKTNLTPSTSEHHLKVNDVEMFFREAVSMNEKYTIDIIRGYDFKYNNAGVADGNIVSSETFANDLIPDATSVISNKKINKKASFFWEIDCETEMLKSNTQNKISICNKLRNYKDYFLTKGYSNLNTRFNYNFIGFRVLFITTSEKRIQNVLELSNELGTSFVWCSEFSKLNAATILTEKIWHTIETIKNGELFPLVGGEK